MVTIIAACCVCKHVRDGLPTDGEGEEDWLPLQSYCSKYQFEERDFKLSHTYCPPCMTRYRLLLFNTTADRHAMHL